VRESVHLLIEEITSNKKVSILEILSEKASKLYKLRERRQVFRIGAETVADTHNPLCN